MILEKKLTIKELFDEMKVLKCRLIKIAEKEHRLMSLVTAITWKDVVVGGGKKGDIMLNKFVKKEELESEFDIVKASYDSYKEQAINEIREMIRSKPIEECIVYFRDSLKWKWEEISKTFNYSARHCRRLYSNAKKQ